MTGELLPNSQKQILIRRAKLNLLLFFLLTVSLAPLFDFPILIFSDQIFSTVTIVPVRIILAGYTGYYATQLSFYSGNRASIFAIPPLLFVFNFIFMLIVAWTFGNSSTTDYLSEFPLAIFKGTSLVPPIVSALAIGLYHLYHKKSKFISKVQLGMKKFMSVLDILQVESKTERTKFIFCLIVFFLCTGLFFLVAPIQFFLYLYLNISMIPVFSAGIGYYGARTYFWSPTEKNGFTKLCS